MKFLHQQNNIIIIIIITVPVSLRVKNNSVNERPVSADRVAS